MHTSSFRIPVRRLTGFFSVYMISLTAATLTFGQQLLMDADMESSAGWTIYHMGSTDTARYEFNYTTDGPSDGVGGCLRVTSEKRTNILFWQKLILKGGKSYQTDGLVKTGYVASFWCEVYMSTIAPVANADYSPNNNNDRVWIISTWEGCGSYLDGKFSEVACRGDGMFIPPGNYDEDVEVYYGIKTGIWNDMEEIEVLLDEFTLELIENWFLLSASEGVLDQDSLKIKNVSPLITVADFKSGLRIPLTASVEIVGLLSGEPVPDQDNTPVSDTMMVQVKGNEITLYQIETREIGTGNDIITALTGTVYPEDSLVTGLPDNARVIQLKSGITVSPYATYRITYSSGEIPLNHSLITSDLVIIVTSENGSEKTYSIEVNGTPLVEETITDSTGTFSHISNRLLNLDGSINWHVTRETNPFEGSMINLLSDDVWIYFDSIRPLEFAEKYLDHILISDSAPVIDENIRLAQYLDGSVLISHSSVYKPLQVYTEDSLKGSSLELEIYTYHRSSELGDFENEIRSFRLKKGYMATMARDEPGTGYSKVYIAESEDIIINRLPDGLYDDVSFIRIFPWRWTTKKGKADGNQANVEMLNCTWHYDWDNVRQSGLNTEYIPMRHNPNWNAFSNINVKKNTTHALGYNEPDNANDDGYSTVEGAIDMWPRLLESGLRLGSPAPTDGGRNWLYDFIDRCDKLNYRVDFVAIHWYWGGSSPLGMYNFLKDIHDRTGRPIWITEWNNGANWTCCLPTYKEQAQKIGEFLYMLDTTSFVERYAIYEWVQDERRMFYPNSNELTPAGEVYRDKISPMAYNPDKAFSIDYLPLPYPAINPIPQTNATNIGIDTILSWTGGEGATSRNIYFGTSYPPPLRKVQSDTFYNPGTLQYLTTYYWRIDEVNTFGTTKGTVWRFTTRFPVSIKTPDSDNKNLTLYPNPADDFVVFSGSRLNKPVTIELYDHSGDKIIHQTLPDDNTISVKRLKSGLYLYRLNDKESIHCGKLVIR